MIKYNPIYIKKEQRKKIKAGKPLFCKVCNILIIPGTEYVGEMYDDGFIRKPIGAYHTHCIK